MNDPKDLRRALKRLVGWNGALRRATASASRSLIHDHGHPMEELVLDGPRGPIPATYIRPERPGPHPAVLYCHAHGGDYRLGRREVLQGSRFLQSPGYGPALANAGFSVLCIDMPGFGERRGEGEEGEMAKALFWQGRSLFGTMLGDQAAALGYLAKRPDVDASRIYTLGLSMGAAHAFWLAALEPGVAGCVHLCMLADIGQLIDAGAHGQHGFYLTVPGFLAVAEMGDVAGLIAPRPQLICHGGKDPLTPETAREAALDRVRAAYEADPDAVTCAIDAAAGHGESAPMRVAVLDFLTNAAAPARPTFHA